ncbi:hypothetical protein ElyMa_006611100 [Elysia marginata]|uniref:Uncharacterized protein n=1 Tax=Elysia marginata TaxID=1093978 RepID=A0AAV4IFJ7_9GAST|nr:hypothetical protein ElyMa_006611100 [Elysia marginata]
MSLRRWLLPVTGTPDRLAAPPPRRGAGGRGSRSSEGGGSRGRRHSGSSSDSSSSSSSSAPSETKTQPLNTCNSISFKQRPQLDHDLFNKIISTIIDQKLSQ